MRYSGKKKTFTNNTNVYANLNGVIIGISKSSVGSTGDITLLREDSMPFGRWEESMHDEGLPEEGRIRIWVDKGYLGTDNDLPGTNLMIPHKRSKNRRTLTAEQKEHNHTVNSTRVLVEHSIGRIKRYARMVDPYDGTIGEFNREFNVITGLVNLHLLWDKIDKGPPSPDRWGRGLTGTGPSPLQAAPSSRENRRTLRCCKGAHEPADTATKNILSCLAPSHYVYNQACDIPYSPAYWIRTSNIGSLRISSSIKTYL